MVQLLLQNLLDGFSGEKGKIKFLLVSSRLNLLCFRNGFNSAILDGNPHIGFLGLFLSPLLINQRFSWLKRLQQ